MKVTFLNDSGKNDMYGRGKEYWESISEDLRTYMTDSDVYENGNEDLSSFYEYGLSFDYVEKDTFNDQKEGYYRYQFCWGGPSAELRFHPDETLEFVFMDWFCGIGFDVSEEEEAQWLYSVCKDLGLPEIQD